MEMFPSMFNNENLATHQHPVPEQEMFEVVEHVNGNEENNNKRRKLKSKVWMEFVRYTRPEDGQVRAKCKHCKRDFDGSSKNGTTHLANHLKACKKKSKGGEDAEKSIKTSELTSTVVIKQNSVIDLIKSLFDEDGFPTEHWDPSVLNSRKVDILQIFEGEKEKLRRFFRQLSGRVSLRITSFRYWSLLTAHYIDENWVQKNTFISFVNCECGGGKSLIASLKAICLDLKIDRKICYVVDNEYTGNFNDDVIGEINSWFTQQGSLPFGGVFSLMKGNPCWDIYCGTTKMLYHTLHLVKNCVAYVNETTSNQDKFRRAVNKVKSMGKKVTSEPLPTYVVDLEDMKIPLGYKEAFCELEQIDPDFKTINLTKEKWDEATAAWELRDSILDVWTFLERGLTRNTCFSKICDVYVKLLVADRSAGHHLGENTSFQIETFTSGRREFIDQYWSKYSLVLVIAVILDPRFKMDIVQLLYNKIYGCDADRHLEKIIHDFNLVYNEYAKGKATSSISYLDNMGMPTVSSPNLISPKSELDRYLKEPKFSSVENFDILAWWRLYSPIFPTLARMARDFLAVPIAFAVSYYWYERVYCIIDDEELDDDIKRALAYFIHYENYKKVTNIFEI